jgi:ABC-type dipeptide/oligopeptide/nickel transport system permease component
LKKSIPVTIELAALAMVFGLVLAILLGVLSATRQDKCCTRVFLRHLYAGL